MRVLFILLILLSGYAFTGALMQLSFWGWLALFLPFLLMLVWVGQVLLANRRQQTRWPRLQEVITHSAFLSMGVVSYLLVFSVFKTLLNLFLPAGEQLGAISVLLAAVVCVGLGMYRALRGPNVKKVELQIEGLPEELKGFSLVQISDLHVGPTIRKNYVQNVADKIKDLRPDVVVMTGDIGDGDAEQLKDEIAPLADLQPEYGVYYAPGNHEYYWNIQRWVQRMQSLGARTLLNEGVVVAFKGKSILIAGVTDPAAEQMNVGEGPNLEKAIAEGAGAHVKILLSHRPGLARPAEKVGFDLQLSGHTHGGQFFPWTWITPLVHEFNLGLAKVGRMWIYVNSGTGSWGPHLRLGTTPEITFFRLR